jgi:Uncharacterized conserved protein (DUF2190)
MSILQSNGKQALNSTGSTIPAGSVCSWTNTSTLQLAEADNLTADTFAGVAYQDIPDGTYGLVVRCGKLPGVVAGLAPVAGQPVFLSTTAGVMTLNTSAYPSGDAVSRIGFAEPPDGAAGLATDLFIEFELVSAF